MSNIEVLQDMHYADFAEDEVRHPLFEVMNIWIDTCQSAALLAAIKEYEASKWKVIGQKVGKPAKVCVCRYIVRSLVTRSSES